MKRVVLYTLTDRLWHWLQAIAFVLLLLTGFEVHAPNAVRLFGFERSARLHADLGLAMVGIGILSVCCTLTTGAIMRDAPKPKDFLSLAVAQIRYYLRGVLSGARHPLQPRLGSGLGILRQVTYLVLLNVLLPTQVATGLLIWAAPTSPEMIGRLGGLGAIAGVHTLAAWLFVAFLVAHLYSSTMGRTPVSRFRTMLLGWEDQPEAEQAVVPPLPRVSRPGP
jgi:thiosulfate reductase cytochrome b subunit